MDGSNLVFTLSAVPANPGSLHLFRNGMLLKQGAGYTLAGAVVTMEPSSPPIAGDSIQAFYRLASEGTDTIQFAESETPAGAVDGSNRSFTLQSAPLPASSLQLFRNGLLQRDGLDFTLTDNILTFFVVAVPQPGDVLQASYRR
jgi:hypothetical protein